MALKILLKTKHNGVLLKSGYFYQFKYTAFQEDPRPMIVFISAIKGIHPKTGHQWRLIQGLNLNYIPRSDRKRFINLWRKNIDKGKTVKFTWNIVQRKYPYLKLAIRRYMTIPKYYIRDLKAIDPANLDKEIIRSWHKDFSMTLKRKLGAKMKKFFVGKR